MKKNRLTSLLLCLCMAVTLLPATPAAAGKRAGVLPAQASVGAVFLGLKQSPYTFAGGSGTREDPYLVSTPDQLNAVRQGLDQHYRLANDIDLSAWGNWLPIGGEALNRYGEAAPFTGSFDGAGHVISGMTITGKRSDYQGEERDPGKEACYFGLFGCVRGREEDIAPGDAYEDTTLGGVFDLGMVDYTIDMDSSDVINGMNIPKIGPVAGVTRNARIVGCWSDRGTARASDEGYVGGIVGCPTNTAIRACWNTSALTGSLVGGIAGMAYKTWISHCFNTGSLKGERVYGIAYGSAGIFSDDEKKTVDLIQYCYNAGTLSGDFAVGIGDAGFMDNVYNAGTLDAAQTQPIYGYNRPLLGISNAGERYLKDENWADSSTLNRKVLAALREDELITSASAVVKGVGGFLDVFAADYYAEAVIWAVDRQVTTGTSNNTFSPADTCTKAQAITFLHRAEGKPDHKDMIDINTFKETNGEHWTDAYYYFPACWARDHGMIAPTTYLHAPCTRADFVTYLWKAAGSPKTQIASQFTDVPANAAYAQAVAWAVAQGITTGTTDTTFSPDTTCTRGQIVTFLYRAYKNK